MKVLHVINSLGTGGAEKLLLETLPLYKERGLQVDILLLWDNNHAFTKKLKELNCCKVFVLKQSENLKDIYSPSHIPAIRSIMKDYDIIHGHLFPTQYFVPLANIGLDKTLVFTEHSTTNTRQRLPILSLLDRSIYRKYAKVISISDDVSKALVKHVPFVDYLKIENGVNLSAIEQANPYTKDKLHPSLQADDKLIIQVSAFRKGKDQLTLLKTLLYLPKHYKVILVGEGNQEEKAILEKFVQEQDLSQRVLFLGQRMDVPFLLKSVDVVCLSSAFEGLSLASVEGMASGKPFIASNVPGLRDVVSGAGLLFELGDAQALAKHIDALMRDKAYYEEVAQQCMQRAKAYDIQVMLDKHIALYQSLYGKA